MMPCRPGSIGLGTESRGLLRSSDVSRRARLTQTAPRPSTGQGQGWGSQVRMKVWEEDSRRGWCLALSAVIRTI